MFIIIYLLCFIFRFTNSANRNLVISSGLDTVLPGSVAISFYINVNNTGKDCQVECTPDRCCLTTEGEDDCDVLEIIGGCSENVPAGTTKTVRLAAPLLNPFERRGYCIVYLDSRPEGRKVLRNTVKITFDTSLDKNPVDDLKPCGKLDEDPLNDCKPVDCDTYYNGRKPHYSKRLNRCVEAPPCIATDSELPDVLYDADTNRCRRNTSVTDADIKFIQSLTSGKRPAKDILIIKNKHPHASVTKSKTKTQNDKDNKGSEDPKDSNSANDATKVLHTTIAYKFLDYLSTYRDTLTVLACVILIQCCFICTMMYCMAKNCQCEKEKTLVSRFFNYRQDVSVTTPLIGTSNNDTETTYQYLSESSANIDKKIKCYKACERNQPHNAKVSMSDDILSKCLTRRDWTHKPKSDAIAELKSEEWNKKEPGTDKVKKSEARVNFENEVKKSKSDIRTKTVQSVCRTKSDNVDVQPSSEQEIQCHTYECDGRNDRGSQKERAKRTISRSTEKGAQACFSNDSIDDFLSERGMLFLAGDNVSKYTFSSESTFNLNVQQHSYSEVSGKTSKNNIVKSVLSMLHRKSKHSPASDPGGKKCDDNLNLELLHMSQASMFSSNESEYLKKGAESRSSL